MLSTTENERMCRVGPGTAMGAAMRRYWLPALPASELPEPDGDPVHVELLGQHFVAFRDTSGQVGILDENCCHRGASLTLGRVEDGGIRCIYHGWKFAADGTVLETPNVPDARVKSRIKAKSYPVREAGGLIWTYLGAPGTEPRFPEWPWMPEIDWSGTVACAVFDCNFVQVVEGLVDSSHLSVLHIDALRYGAGLDYDFTRKTSHMQFDASPRIEVDDTDFGFHYAALRTISGDEGSRIEARIASFVAPCFVCNPNGDVWIAAVPINDNRTAFYNVFWDPSGQVDARLKFVGANRDYLDRRGLSLTTAGRPCSPSRNNRFGQDRAIMNRGSFSGIGSLMEEDVAVAVSSGAIRDRSREHLSIADLAIGRLYRVLLACAEAGIEGKAPIGVDSDTRQIVGTSGTLQPGTDWRSLVPNHKILRADPA